MGNGLAAMSDPASLDLMASQIILRVSPRIDLPHSGDYELGCIVRTWMHPVVGQSVFSVDGSGYSSGVGGG